MSANRSGSRMRSAGGSGRASARLGSAGSVAITPPRSPAMNRVPSGYLVKEVETPPSPSKWQKQHEQVMFRQISFQRENKKVSNRQQRDKAQKLARKIPVEMLAKEWLNDSQATLDTRCFMVENLLPTLILGLEKLLIEADNKQLVEKHDSDPNFNPINYLAQYLMRNNPRYSNFSEASPYVKSLREVGELLKAQIFQLEDNKLAKIKNDARRKREDREKAAELRKQEKIRRHETLESQFIEWSANEDGRVELALVQSALRSFQDMVEYLPSELQSKAKFSQPLDATDDSGKTIMRKEFIEYVNGFVDDYAGELFDEFINHMSRCANAYHSEVERDQRKTTLQNLFLICDHTGVGVLDRHRILSLFESFYDKQTDIVKQTIGLRNPRKWPVVEVDEADSDYSDDEEEATETEDKQEQKAKEVSSNSTVADDTLASVSGESLKEERPSSAEEKHEAEHSEKSKADTSTEENLQVDESSEGKAAVSSENLAENNTSEVKAAEDVSAVEKPEVDGPADEKPTEDKPLEDEPVENENKPDESSESEAADGKDKEAADEVKPLAEAHEQKSSETHVIKEAPTVSKTAESDRPGMSRQLTRIGTQVSFAEGTNLGLTRERTTLETRGTGSQSRMSAFDENTINIYQFIQLTETFLGDYPALEIFQSLCKYMRDGYVETEDEKLARLMRAHKEAQMIKQKNRLDGLFEKWDNEGSGYLELSEFDTIAHKYKDGLERQAINRGRHKFLTKQKQEIGQTDNRVTKSEFRDLVTGICEEIPGDSTFDFFVDFLENCVERTYAERIRGEARKKWLQQIINSAETSAASLEVVYRSVFQALYRDAETHGNGKVLSGNVAMLENNTKAAARGGVCLRYTAATSDDAAFLLNQILYKDMRGISFAAIETGKPLHVPRVSNHGNVQFWNPQREEDDREGSFVVVPLKDKRKRVFGTLGIDTLRDPRSKSIFITHEIQFYQGVAKAFSIAFHNVDTKRKTLRITESAISWILRRSESVFEINVYLVEPDGKNEDYVLRRMMLAHGEKAEVKTFDAPSRLERKDNLFRDYLFKCVDNSETVTADAYGQRHSAFPLRGADGRAVAVIDISTGETKTMPKYEKKEILRMLKLVQRAQKEITKERTEGEKTLVLEAEKENEDVRVEIMFDRLMLQDLRKVVDKLDAKAFAELKYYSDPPKVIHNIVKATLNLFHPDKAASDTFNDWKACKSHINNDLHKKIAKFDPTVEGSENIPIEYIEPLLADIPHGMVGKHSSAPAECLYDWIFVCLSLIQHTKRMRLSENQYEKTRPMLPTGMTPDLTARTEDDD